MGNNPATWSLLISLLSLALAGIAFVRTDRFREDLIRLQLPLLDFWREVERESDEWVVTWTLHNKGPTAAELSGWSIFIDGKSVDLPESRQDWLSLLNQIGVDGQGGYGATIGPGFPMEAKQVVTVLELRCAIPSDDKRYSEIDRLEDALKRINIKCQYTSPGVDFEDEIYLRYSDP